MTDSSPSDAGLLPWYRRLLEVLPDSVEFVDSAVRLVEINPAFTWASGFDREAALGKTTAELFRDDFADPAYYADIMRTLRRRGTWRGPMASRRSDGTVGFQAATLAAVTDELGQVIGFIAIKRGELDTAEPEASEESLRRDSSTDGASMALERLRTLMDAGADAWFLTTRAGRIVDSNATAERFTGLTRNGLSGRILQTLVSGAPKTDAPWRAFVRRVDGGQLPVEARTSTVVLAGTHFEFVAVRDISDRSEVEARLVEANAQLQQMNARLEERVEERTQALLKATRQNASLWARLFPMRIDLDAFLGIHGASDELRAWARLSPAATRLTCEDLFGADATARLRQAALQLPPGDVTEFELEAVDRTGVQLWLRAVLVAAGAGRGPGEAAFVLYLSDDTRRRADAESERRSQQSGALGRLAMGIAHDFNNLLTPVLSNAEALMAALPATMPRERESAEEISVAALMARDIVAKILAFARNSADSGRVVLDARDACRDTVRLVRTTAPRGISVLFDADDAQLFVRGQARDLEQVVLNLCMNALKAMSNEGLLRVQVRAAKGSEGVEGVEISVEDSGCGIPRDRIARIFEPHFSAGEGQRSTGLGLATVDSIVRSLGGHIRVHSVVGQGTRFIVWLPAVQAPGGVRLDSVESSPGDAVPRVLCIDDEPAVLRALQRTLARLGCHVDTLIGSTDLVLDYDALETYDLILLDWNMPGLGGEAIRDLVSARFPNLPIAQCSGYVDGLSVPEPTQPPYYRVPKPFAKEDLEYLLRHVRKRAQARG